MKNENEISVEIANGKCVSHKLPSYMTMTNKKETTSSVAEDVLFR